MTDSPKSTFAQRVRAAKLLGHALVETTER